MRWVRFTYYNLPQFVRKAGGGETDSLKFLSNLSGRTENVQVFDEASFEAHHESWFYALRFHFPG